MTNTMTTAAQVSVISPELEVEAVGEDGLPPVGVADAAKEKAA